MRNCWPDIYNFYSFSQALWYIFHVRIEILLGKNFLQCPIMTSKWQYFTALSCRMAEKSVGRWMGGWYISGSIKTA